MAALGDTQPHRHTFFVFSVLIAANLVLITYNVAKSNIDGNSTQSAIQSDQPSLQVIFEEFAQATGIPSGLSKATSLTKKNFKHTTAFVGSAVSGDTRFVSRATGSGVHAMVHAENNVISFTSNIVDVNTYIKPVSTPKVPVISPVPTLAIVKAIAAVSPPTSPVTQEAAQIKTATASPTIPSYDMTNTYAWGNCTWWVAIERARVGDFIPNTWGNAATWGIRAAYDGYTVNHTPTPGSIMQTADSAGGLGHVAFVTSVDPDGTWHISEMNVLGLDRVDDRTMSPAATAYYYFIHDKN